jgi:hypothetical protein
VTPPGIDPETLRLVVQCLNHYATPDPPTQAYHGRIVDHSSAPALEVKNEWSYTSAPPTCLHSVDRDNCNATLLAVAPLVSFVSSFAMNVLQKPRMREPQEPRLESKSTLLSFTFPPFYLPVFSACLPLPPPPLLSCHQQVIKRGIPVFSSLYRVPFPPQIWSPLNWSQTLTEQSTGGRHSRHNRYAMTSGVMRSRAAWPRFLQSANSLRHVRKYARSREAVCTNRLKHSGYYIYRLVLWAGIA